MKIEFTVQRDRTNNGERAEWRRKRLHGEMPGRQSTIGSYSTVSRVVGEVLSSPGRALDFATRAIMEPRFGHDFSLVRVHTDERAAESARGVNAFAYTVGHSIVFGAGQFSPHSGDGQKLIAHELAHVIQQEGGGGNAGVLSSPHDRFEQEAREAAASVLAGKFVQVRPAGPLPGVQRDEKKTTPEEIAAGALTAGPKGGKKVFEKAVRTAAETEAKGKETTRIEVPAAGKDDPVKGVTSSEFASRFKKCGTARMETGLPKAFLCVTHGIAPPDVASDENATIATNVRVAFSGGATSGKTWVTSANLPWTLDTAGFLDIDSIDPKMLAPYGTHEKGHRTIAHQIRDRLAKMLQGELEIALPGEKRPLSTSGEGWAQQGVNAIIKQISAAETRYQNWFDELATNADAAWDGQEKKTLSNIASAIKAKESKPGSSVPDVPEE